MARLVVVGLVLAWMGVSWALRRRRLLEASRVRAGTRLPHPLRTRATRRCWVLATSPSCTACGPVAEKLRELDPRSRLVTFDVTRERHWARLLRAEVTPTLLLAGRDGDVILRLTGPDAIEAHLDADLTQT